MRAKCSIIFVSWCCCPGRSCAQQAPRPEVRFELNSWPWMQLNERPRLQIDSRHSIPGNLLFFTLWDAAQNGSRICLRWFLRLLPSQQLEDGEVNAQLARTFMACARREFRASTKVLRAVTTLRTVFYCRYADENVAALSSIGSAVHPLYWMRNAPEIKGGTICRYTRSVFFLGVFSQNRSSWC